MLNVSSARSGKSLSSICKWMSSKTTLKPGKIKWQQPGLIFTLENRLPEVFLSINQEFISKQTNRYCHTFQDTSKEYEVR